MNLTLLSMIAKFYSSRNWQGAILKLKDYSMLFQNSQKFSNKFNIGQKYNQY
ncbi:hypothetical protein PL11201_770014 [Planktothrix sp. PCC 11201]|nr:hypothetical protein PL11201_770014 [Planktothrix sp. PCC 11201]